MTFLDTLKSRAADALKRFQETHSRLQVATAENQAASQEYESWKKAVEVETKREQALATMTPAASVVASETVSAKDEVVVQLEPPTTETNKTELIRDLLRQNPGGMRPVEVWKALKNQIPQRGYVYAVLGRLKSRDQVSVKRGKYYCRASVKPEEAKQERAATFIQ